MNRLVFIVINFLFYATASGQFNDSIQLREALINIAIEHNLNLVFKTNNIEQKTVVYTRGLSINDQLKEALRRSHLSYEIKENQLLLFQEHESFGYIMDSESGEHIIGATLIETEGAVNAVTNEYGFFSLKYRIDSLQVIISYVGYEPVTKIFKGSDTKSNNLITLKRNTTMEEVVISDALNSPYENKLIKYTQGIDIHLFQNQSNSAIGGEPDILQGIIRQPGINSGTDGLGGVHVRGGKNDQNLFLLDGVKIYNPTHAFGIYSIVNNSIIDQVSFIKNGSNKEYSGRLSSIVNIKTQSPELDKVSAFTQITTLANQGGINIPVIKDKVAIAITGRQTHVGPLIRSLTDLSDDYEFTQGFQDYQFTDLSLSSKVVLSRNIRLGFTLYQSNDVYNNEEKYDDRVGFTNYLRYSDEELYQWNNRIASLRFNAITGSSSFLSISLSRYNYKFNNRLNYFEESQFDGIVDNDSFRFSSNSGIKNYTLRIKREQYLDRHNLSWGATYERKEFNVGKYVIENTTTPIDPEIKEFELEDFTSAGTYKSNEFTFYLTDQFRASQDATLNTGVYFTYTDARDVDYEDIVYKHYLLSGYIKGLVKVSDKLFIGGSLSTNTQTEHLLTISDNGYPNDIWIPSTDFTPPSRAYQADIFADISFDEHQFKAALYYKKQNGLIWYDTISALPALENFVFSSWESDTQLGSANGYGGEISYLFSSQNFVSRVNYTLGRTYHNFPFINDGKDFLYDYSIDHTIAFGADIRFSDKLRMNIDWYFASGRPYSGYASDSEFSPLNRNVGSELIPISGYNDLSLPANHKLSVSLETYWMWKELTNRVSMGIQNLYNHRNEIYRYDLIDSDGFLQEKSQRGFPLLPMIRWKIQFN